MIGKLTEENIPLAPKMFSVNLEVNARKHKLIDFTFLQAERAIALKWKETQAPFPNKWFKELTSNLALEKLTCS